MQGERDMKMASNCYPCILDRAKFECDMVFSQEEEKRAAVEELLDYMACHKGRCIGTGRHGEGEDSQEAQQ